MTVICSARTRHGGSDDDAVRPAVDPSSISSRGCIELSCIRCPGVRPADAADEPDRGSGGQANHGRRGRADQRAGGQTSGGAEASRSCQTGHRRHAATRRRAHIRRQRRTAVLRRPQRDDVRDDSPGLAALQLAAQVRPRQLSQSSRRSRGELDRLARQPDLHLQAARRRQIPRRFDAHFARREGQLRPHHCAARRRDQRSPTVVRSHRLGRSA